MSAARLAVGDRAPLFELPDAHGAAVALEPERHAASVVVVLQLVSNDATDHPEDSAAAMRDRVSAGELAGPFLHDAEQQAARAYGATATPEVFVLDREGVVRY